MSSAPSKPPLTPEEYLALEREAEFKSEYFEGVVTAMAGASRRHNLIAGNLFRAISTQLLGRPCETYTGEMRVRVTTKGLYTYPDVVVVCGEPQFIDKESDTLINPTLIVEVLSRSTESRDRGFKFSQYRKLESLKEYVLVSQEHLLVERFLREGESWTISYLSQIGDRLILASIGCDVGVNEIYDRVDFLRVDDQDTA